jgi:cytochrome c
LPDHRLDIRGLVSRNANEEVQVLTVARCFIVPLAAFLALSAGAASAAGDAAKGFQIFKGTCGVCHLARNDMSTNDAATKIGPNLYGVVGRKAGSVPHFRYSAAMHDSGVIWTSDMLRRYAHAPQKTIPNVRMSFPGLPNQTDADDVVAYLATLSGPAHK